MVVYFYLCSPPRFLFMALEGEKGQGSASDTDTDTDTTGKQERLSGTIKKLFAGRLMNYIEVGCLEQISKTDGQQCPGLLMKP